MTAPTVVLQRQRLTNELHGTISAGAAPVLRRAAGGVALQLNQRLSAAEFVIWGAEEDSQDSWDSWDRRFLAHLRGCLREGLSRFPQLQEVWEDGEEDALSLLDECDAPLRTTVALCTTCHNRLWQLHLALPISLLLAWPFRRSCTFHVLDYGSKDPDPPKPEPQKPALTERSTLLFLMKTCRVAMDAGLLKVHRCEAQHWHASIAKNTVHLRAMEDILVNLDADNIAGPGFVLDVLQRFGRARMAAAHYRVEGVAGTVGRIACRRRDFLYLQGYDEEDAHPAGAQDIDLWLRLSMLAKSQEQIVEKVNDGTKAMAIPNTWEEKTAFTGSALTWKAMNQENWELFEMRRATSTSLRRNCHRRQFGLRSRELRFVKRTWHLIECWDEAAAVAAPSFSAARSPKEEVEEV
eukprot:s685_g13.t1